MPAFAAPHRFNPGNPFLQPYLAGPTSQAGPKAAAHPGMLRPATNSTQAIQPYSSSKLTPPYSASLQEAGIPRPKPYTFTDDVVDILHLNDYHEAFSVLPQMITGLKQLTQQGQQAGHTVLRFDTGDSNIAAEAEDWALNVRLMNQMNLDAATLGNHEFDLGTPLLSMGLEKANFPEVVANLATTPYSSLFKEAKNGHWVATSLILDRKGKKYGVIGVTTPNLLHHLHEGVETEGTYPFSIQQTARIVQHQVDELEKLGIKRVFLLSHMGYQTDLDLINPSKGGVHGIDVIIGGHSHTEIKGVKPGKNFFQDSLGQPVLIVQTGQNGHNLGKTTVSFDGQGWIHPQGADLIKPQQFKPDPEALRAVHQRFGPDKPVAQLLRPYDNSHIGTQEDPLANLMADYIWAMAKTDMAFFPSADIRDSAHGVVTRQHIREMFPFNNPIVTVKVKGKDLIATFEQEATMLMQHKTHPGLLHPSSNLHIQLNSATGHVDKALWKNSRTGDWEPIDKNETYTIAIDDYTIGSDEYPYLKGDKPISELPGSMASLFEGAVAWRQEQTPGSSQFEPIVTATGQSQHPLASLPTLELAPDGRLIVVKLQDNSADRTSLLGYPFI